jgi:hypothetical protein
VVCLKVLSQNGRAWTFEDIKFFGACAHAAGAEPENTKIHTKENRMPLTQRKFHFYIILLYLCNCKSTMIKRGTAGSAALEVERARGDVF